MAEFELYRLLVEEVREARRARRELSNAFLTLNLAGVGAVGFLAKGDAQSLHDPVLLLWFLGALMFTCWIWRTSNRYYTHMLGAKYAILYDVEKQLPNQPIKAEWDRLHKLKPAKSFSLEYAMPVLFALGYVVMVAHELSSSDFAPAVSGLWVNLLSLLHR